MSPLAARDYSLRIPIVYDDTPDLAAFPIGVASAALAFSANEHAAPEGKRLRKHALYRAAAASVAIHLIVLALFLGRSESSRQLGAEKGTLEDLNVSIITDADLRSLSMDRSRRDAPPPISASVETESQPPSQDVPSQSSPSPDGQTSPEKSAAAKGPLPPQPEKPEDTEGLIAKAYEQFASAVTKAIDGQASQRKQAQRSPQSSANLRSYRPAATRSGKSSEFEREVIWALDATKPQGNGKWGITAVTFTVSSAGQVQDLKLMRSSGDNWLDTAALMSVRQARLPVPSPGLTHGDRSFQIHYISR